ncbi:MAG: 5-formyltetrahydrofolate cyclo-ligase [Clostridia bacterium]|nr:5-formyltetrahydrofolate cyclo-ligase [Clostridia bacterium]
MKSELRKEFIKKRILIDTLTRADFGRMIWERVKALDVYKSAENILCYASVGYEVDTYNLMRTILADGKKLYLPRCEVETHSIIPCQVYDLAELEKGAYGIPEPSGEGVSPSVFDLVIVPAVAFDRSKARLGYGGGYYDRFLPKTDAIKCLIAFRAQEAQKIPCEKTDIPMDMIVTEREVIT